MFHSSKFLVESLELESCSFEDHERSLLVLILDLPFLILIFSSLLSLSSFLFSFPRLPLPVFRFLSRILPLFPRLFLPLSIFLSLFLVCFLLWLRAILAPFCSSSQNQCILFIFSPGLSSFCLPFFLLTVHFLSFFWLALPARSPLFSFSSIISSGHHSLILLPFPSFLLSSHVLLIFLSSSSLTSSFLLTLLHLSRSAFSFYFFFLLSSLISIFFFLLIIISFYLFFLLTLLSPWSLSLLHIYSPSSFFLVFLPPHLSVLPFPFSSSSSFSSFSIVLLLFVCPRW